MVDIQWIRKAGRKIEPAPVEEVEIVEEIPESEPIEVAKAEESPESIEEVAEPIEEKPTSKGKKQVSDGKND